MRLTIGLVCLAALAGCDGFEQGLPGLESVTAPVGTVEKGASAREIAAHVSGGGGV